jgi:hypothetical protein
MAKVGESTVIMESLRALPWESLSPSALVDFVLLLACNKPAIRLIIKSRSAIGAVASWCSTIGFDFASDLDAHICVARGNGGAVRTLKIDQRPDPHEFMLGRALGYPGCCCERVAAVGESNIDLYAEEVAAWQFVGKYARINPSGYRRGYSLISHLPCHPACDASLGIANQARAFVLEHRNEPLLSNLSNFPS